LNNSIVASGTLRNKEVVGLASFSGTESDPVAHLVRIINGEATIPLYGDVNLASHILTSSDSFGCLITGEEQYRLNETITPLGIVAIPAGSTFNSSAALTFAVTAINP
jgi:hypothetical protein